MTNKVIAVRPETHERIMGFKIACKAKNFNEVLNKLLDFWETGIREEEIKQEEQHGENQTQ